VSADPYHDEAQARWGDTEAYRESQRRLSGYSAEDVELAKKQAAEAVQMFLDAMTAGLPADSPEAAAAAEAHRKAISDWWYACSYDMQTNLAAMYLQDSRFTQHYEDVRPGLAQYVHDAIFANALANS
jgi:hypothetical protein